MDILLLNDATFAPYFPRDWRVLAAGPQAHYVMPEQDQFQIWLGPGTEQDLEEVLTKCRALYPGFDPDVIIQFETSLNYFYTGIERSNALTIWRLIDTHMFSAWQPYYAQVFDLTLVAQKDYLPLFPPFTEQVHWLPLCTNRKVHQDRGVARDIPVSFVGSMNPTMHPERVKFFSALQALVPIQVFSGKNQQEISEIYNRSQVVINECLSRDLNYRLFEALSNGALCLTPKIDAGQDELFVDGQDIVTYQDKDVNDAAAKIQALLADPARIERIRRSGHEKVSQSHDIQHRVETVIGLIHALRAQRPVRRFYADKLLSLIPLLGEFTFGLKRISGTHMHELLVRARRMDPPKAAYYLTSLGGKWLQRQHAQAAGYFVKEARATGFTDARLEPAWRELEVAVAKRLAQEG